MSITKAGTLINAAMREIKKFEPTNMPDDYDEQVATVRNEIHAMGYDDRTSGVISQCGKEIYNKPITELMAHWVVRYRCGMTIKGICFYGDPGLGKTHGLQILAKMIGCNVFSAPAVVGLWSDSESVLKEIGKAEVLDERPQQGVWQEKGVAVSGRAA